MFCCCLTGLPSLHQVMALVGEQIDSGDEITGACPAAAGRENPARRSPPRACSLLAIGGL